MVDMKPFNSNRDFFVPLIVISILSDEEGGGLLTGEGENVDYVDGKLLPL
jgi:hypothetical protein